VEAHWRETELLIVMRGGSGTSSRLSIRHLVDKTGTEKPDAVKSTAQNETPSRSLDGGGLDRVEHARDRPLRSLAKDSWKGREL